MTLVAGLLAAGSPVAAHVPDDDEYGLREAGLDAPELGVEYLREIRRGLNLASDREAMRAAGKAQQHELTGLVDIPLTADEATELLERAEFVQNAHASVIDPVSREPGFAGWRVDLANGAGVVEVFLVEPSRSQVRHLPEAVVDKRGDRRVKISAARYSLTELEAAMMMVWDVWERRFPDVALHAVEVDVVANGLVVSVDPERVPWVSSELAKRRLAGVAPGVTATAGTAAVETACSGRESCTSPMRAGNVMRRGSDTGGRCTMGFNVRSGSSRGWLTAGHCSHGSSRPNNWFHQGWSGQVGTVQRTAYSTTTTDAMRVSMPANQASSRIYGRSELVGNWRNPGVGEMACGSLGVTNTVRCGSVTSASTSWTGDACSCTVIGARATYSTQGGDSGHPVFTVWTSTRVIAVGLGNTSGGGFARIDDAINRTGGWTPLVN